jgi:hypothetical protein
MSSSGCRQLAPREGDTRWQAISSTRLWQARNTTCLALREPWLSHWIFLHGELSDCLTAVCRFSLRSREYCTCMTRSPSKCDQGTHLSPLANISNGWWTAPRAQHSDDCPTHVGSITAQLFRFPSVWYGRETHLQARFSFLQLHVRWETAGKCSTCAAVGVPLRAHLRSPKMNSFERREGACANRWHSRATSRKEKRN